jgi:hypothetical protein
MSIETILTIIIFAGFGAAAYLASKAVDGLKKQYGSFQPMTTDELRQRKGFSSQGGEYGVSTSDMLTNPAYSYLSSNIHNND